MAFGSVEADRKIDHAAVQAELTKFEQVLAKAGMSARRALFRMRTMADYLRDVQRAKHIQRCAFMPEPARDPKTGDAIERRNHAPCGGRLRRSGGLLTCNACGRVSKG